MATSEEEEPTQIDKNATEPNDSDSSSDDDLSSDEEAATATPVEWLATGRERRSTAGNRMKSMIAAEEPDDELELLFAEDEDDAGFTDVGDDGSDVQMDSSSDEEDAQENADDLEGEKELEKQARESRQAARKRKAQEAIPMKFRKKVKINTTTTATDTGTSTPAELKPRPKKKSERTSWLPSPADMPTRASKRGTTMLSKEQLHRQMIEREVKRLKQVEAMERKAKKMEALKKPPKTQAERLAEAAIIEKKNAKSLNRWEEAEKQREEERRAKLAALNNRTLDGPVVTFWSGVGEWVDGKLRHVGKIVTIEEKPAKKKRVSNVAPDPTPEDSKDDKDSNPKEKESVQEEAKTTSTSTHAPATSTKATVEGSSQEPKNTTTIPQVVGSTDERPPETSRPVLENPPPSQLKLPATAEKTTNTQIVTVQETAPSPPVNVTAQPVIQPVAKPPETKSPEIKPPDMRPPASNIYTTSMFAPPQQTGLMKPPEMKPPSFLAPPAGVAQGGLSTPMIGYHSTPSKSSNVLAPPSSAQRQSPLSMPQTNAHPPPPTPASVPTPPPSTPVSAPTSVPAPAQAPAAPQSSQPATLPTPKASAQKRRPSTIPLGHQKPTHTNAAKQQELVPPPPPSPPANGKATRNCIILQNFDENAIKEKPIQNRILFGKEMSKLAKPSPAPRCVITNHPARYRDPKTGLPYYNSYAYQEIQKLQRGSYKWSRLVGAWVGSGSEAANGVPARFLDPKAPGPPNPPPEPAEADEGSEKGKDSESKSAESLSTSAATPAPISTPVADTSDEHSAIPAPKPIEPLLVTTPVVASSTSPSEHRTRPMISHEPGPAAVPPPMASPAPAPNTILSEKDPSTTPIPTTPFGAPITPASVAVTGGANTTTSVIGTPSNSAQSAGPAAVSAAVGAGVV